MLTDEQRRAYQKIQGSIANAKGIAKSAGLQDIADLLEAVEDLRRYELANGDKERLDDIP